MQNKEPAVHELLDAVPFRSFMIIYIDRVFNTLFVLLPRVLKTHLSF